MKDRKPRDLESRISSLKNSFTMKVAAYFLAIAGSINLAGYSEAGVITIEEDTINFGQVENTTNSTVSPNFTAWEAKEDGVDKILYYYNEDKGKVLEVPYTGVHNPDADLDELVYTSSQGIHLSDLSDPGNNTHKVVFPAFPGVSYSNAQKIGRDIVFLMSSATSGSQIMKYNLTESMPYPISSSTNEKGKPGVLKHIVAWPEFTDGAWNIHYIDTRNSKEKVLNATRGANSESCSVGYSVGGRIMIVFPMNPNPPDPSKSSSIWAYYPDEDKWQGPSSENNCTVPVYNVNFSNGFAVYQLNISGKPEIGIMPIRNLDFEEVSRGTSITDISDELEKPDVYGASEDLAYVTASGSESQADNQSLGPGSSLSFRKVQKTAGPGRCGDNGTIYLPGDYNQDCYINLKDMSILSQKWISQSSISDLRSVGENWLETTDPENPNCEVYK